MKNILQIYGVVDVKAKWNRNEVIIDVHAENKINRIIFWTSKANIRCDFQTWQTLKGWEGRCADPKGWEEVSGYMSIISESLKVEHKQNHNYSAITADNVKFHLIWADRFLNENS